MSGCGEPFPFVRAVAERLLLRVAAPAQIALGRRFHQRTVGGENFDLAADFQGAVGQGLDGDFAHGRILPHRSNAGCVGGAVGSRGLNAD